VGKPDAAEIVNTDKLKTLLATTETGQVEKLYGSNEARTAACVYANNNHPGTISLPNQLACQMIGSPGHWKRQDNPGQQPDMVLKEIGTLIALLAGAGSLPMGDCCCKPATLVCWRRNAGAEIRHRALLVDATILGIANPNRRPTSKPSIHGAPSVQESCCQQISPPCGYHGAVNTASSWSCFTICICHQKKAGGPVNLRLA
jgi:hypothetical protein